MLDVLFAFESAKGALGGFFVPPSPIEGPAMVAGHGLSVNHPLRDAQASRRVIARGDR